MEIKFTGQSKATVCQIKMTEEDLGKEEQNDKILEEAKRIYSKGLSIANNFTMQQSR